MILDPYSFFDTNWKPEKKMSIWDMCRKDRRGMNEIAKTVAFLGGVRKCVECEKQGIAPNRIDILGSTNTSAYIPYHYDGDGEPHLHDTNRSTERCKCNNGHTFTGIVLHTCWCGWKQEA